MDLTKGLLLQRRVWLLALLSLVIGSFLVYTRRSAALSGWRSTAHDTDEWPSWANTLSMSRDQCDAYFPQNADRARQTREWYDKNGAVTWNMVINAARTDPPPSARVVLINGRMHVSHYHPSFQSRSMAILMSMASAVSLHRLFVELGPCVYCTPRDQIEASPEPLPDVDLSFGSGDVGQGILGRWELTARASEEPSGWLLADLCVPLLVTNASNADILSTQWLLELAGSFNRQLR